VAAAGYAIDLARACGVLTDNLVWSDFGHLLNIAAETAESFSNELSATERGAFFRILLSANGAAFIFLARELKRTPRFPSDNGWEQLATRMAVWIYEQYLDLSTDMRFRTDLRHLVAKRGRSPFTGKSGPHQTFFHLQALTRLGLLRHDEEKGARQYVLDDVSGERIERFAAALPDVRSLERILENDEWEHVGQVVYGSGPRALGDDSIFRHLLMTYRFVEETHTPLVPLSTLSDAVKVHALAQALVPPSSDSILRVLMRAQSKYPRQIRLHVDRRGMPAFVKIAASVSDAPFTSF
jgi:hypothetical protein